MSWNDHYVRFQVFWKDSEKKPLPLMFKEFLRLWVIKGSFPLHYFGRFLYRKGYDNPYNYMDMKQYRSIIYSKKNNQEAYAPILSNKFIFSLFCERNQLPTPNVYSYNMNGSFFYHDHILPVRNSKDLLKLFTKVFQTSGVDKLFVKSFCGYGGNEVFLLTSLNLSDELEKLGNTILSGAFIHQQCIAQHAGLSQIYPHSINTLRVETYIDNSGMVNILGMFMRFGSGGKIVDNVSSGGFYVPVERSSGKLMAKGLQGMIFGGKVFYRHPDSNFEFKDYKVPYFDEAKNLCLRLATYIPIRLAGWDIAFTPSGPVVIEGNNTPGITVGEIGCGGYVNHPLFSEMIGKR